MKTCKFSHTEKCQSWPGVTPDRWYSSVTQYPNKALEPVSVTLPGHRHSTRCSAPALAETPSVPGRSNCRQEQALGSNPRAKHAAGIFDTAAFLLLVFAMQTYPRHLKLLKATIQAISMVIANRALPTAEAAWEHFILSSCRKTISVLKCYGLAIPISLLVPLQQIAVLQSWPTSTAFSSTGITAISESLSTPRISIFLFQMVAKHTASRGIQSTRKHIPQAQSGLEENALEVASVTSAFKRKFNTSLLKLTFL